MLRPTLARDCQRPFKNACYVLSHLSGRGSCIIEKWNSDGVDQISPQSSTIPIYSCIYRVYTSICRWVYCTVLFIESMASVCAQAPPHSEGIHEFLPRRVKAAFPPRCSQAWCLSLHSTIFYLQPHIFAVHNVHSNVHDIISGRYVKYMPSLALQFDSSFGLIFSLHSLVAWSTARS